jgi:hypothetical protein
MEHAEMHLRNLKFVQVFGPKCERRALSGVPMYVMEVSVNIRPDLTGINCEGVDWVKMPQDGKSQPAAVNTVTKVLVP